MWSRVVTGLLAAAGSVACLPQELGFAPDPANGGALGGATGDHEAGGSAGVVGGGAGGDGTAGALPPSCEGLPVACGPRQDADCCSSELVPGGTYYRSNDPDYPATVSDFRLDVYEITVGRFRRFVEAYVESWPREGSGNNPNNPEDPGWRRSFSGWLLADQAQLVEALKCEHEDGSSHTWTDGGFDHENRPINCITWYEAYAFCIWDGGRLPTEAEWNYAAAGGDEQRVYPWSDPPTSEAINSNFAVYSSSSDDQLLLPEPVGSRSPLGDGRYGHADLGGNLWEWVQDWYSETYPAGKCQDCAHLIQEPPDMSWVARGGSFRTNSGTLHTHRRNGGSSLSHQQRGTRFGARCARDP